MLKISVSAGHGFNTPGKRTPDGMPEWYFNSVVVKYLMAALAEYDNVAVIRLDDPTGVQDIPLTIRSDCSNAWGADIHIDVHANAFGNDWNDANGIETFINNFFEAESEILANEVQNNLIETTKLKNRGVKAGNLHMLREVKAKVKILVEAGFMTNQKEAALLKSDEYRKTVANAILDAIVTIYSLKKRVTKVAEDKKGDRPLNLNGSQFQMLAKAYKNAYDKKILSSDKWHKKAAEKTLTVDEATFLNAIIMDRIIK
jgi:N-acetylmuramoyl-L-alanine amidase